MLNDGEKSGSPVDVLHLQHVCVCEGVCLWVRMRVCVCVYVCVCMSVFCLCVVLCRSAYTGVSPVAAGAASVTGLPL